MLRRLFQFREGEARRAVTLFVYLFLVVSSYIVTKTTRDALFLGRFSAVRLPWADIAAAAAMTLAMFVYLRLARHARVPTLLSSTLAMAAGANIGFWALARNGEPAWMLPALYVWTSAIGVLLPAQVWTLASQVMTTREAKRIFGFVGAGAISGAIVGGIITKAAATRLGAHSLLLISAAMLSPCPFLVHAVWRERKDAGDSTAAPARTHSGAGDAIRIILDSSHLRAVAGLIAISSVITTIVSWQFRAVAKATIANTNELAAFFGTFNIYAGALSLFAQLFLSSRLLKRFGLRTTLLIVPVALWFGSMGLLVMGSLAAVVFLKGTDQVLRYSIDRSTVELLYLPVPGALRTRAKAFIDTVVWRTGDALGALIVLGTVAIGGNTVAKLSGVALAVIGIWIAAAFAARRTYVDALVSSIHEHRLDMERLAEQATERSTAEVLIAALGSPDPSVRKDAIAGLSAFGDTSAVTLVQGLATDEDRDVRAEALVYLARCGAVDPLTQIAALEGVHEAALTSAIAHFLAQPGSAEGADTIRVLLDAAPPEARRQIPELLERIGTASAARHLQDYLFDGDPLMRTGTLSALNRTQQDGDNGPVDVEAVEVILDAEILGHYRSYQLLATVDGSSAEAEAMQVDMKLEIERIFRLVKLLSPEHDLHSAYVGVQSTSAAVHANALEFLEHALPPRLRASLLPLIDGEVSVAERIAIAQRLMGPTDLAGQ